MLPKQRRSTLAMMGKAGVEPAETRVRAGDAALAELTGAREPSGVPVKPEKFDEPRRPQRPSGEHRYGGGGDRHGGGERYGSRGPRSGPRSGPRRTH